jgi:hypothetical protein
VVLQETGSQPRYRIRLMGTDAASLYASDLTGRFIDEALPPAPLARYRWIADCVVRTCTPIRNVGRVQVPQREWMISEVAAMPLVEDGATKIVLASAVAWPEESPPDAVRRRWIEAFG